MRNWRPDAELAQAKCRDLEREIINDAGDRLVWNTAIEECARVIAGWDLTDWDHDCDFKDVLAAVADAICARKL